MCQALGDSCWTNALTVSCSYCCKAITHIETPNQLGLDHQLAVRQQNVEACTLRIQLYIYCTYGSRLVDTIVEDRNTAIGLQNVITDIIAVENGGRLNPRSFVSSRVQHFKKTCFSPAIIIEGFMKIQVFVGNIRYNTYIKVAATNPLQLQTVGGSFDDGVRNTRVKHAPQVLLHFQRFKCTLSCSILPFLPADPEVRSCHQTRL